MCKCLPGFFLSTRAVFRYFFGAFFFENFSFLRRKKRNVISHVINLEAGKIGPVVTVVRQSEREKAEKEPERTIKDLKKK